MLLFVKFVLIVAFILGSAMFWFVLLTKIRFNRTSKMAMFFERIRAKEKEANFQAQMNQNGLSAKERAFAERARFAGLPGSFTYNKFNMIRLILCCSFIFLLLVAQVSNSYMLTLMSTSVLIVLVVKLSIIGFTGWIIPSLLIKVKANERRSKVLLEIAKFSHRLSICVTDKADIREVIMRAGRTLKILKPDLQELAAMWGKDQRYAIMRFKESVGITEIFPLVNALNAISEADAKDVAEVLRDQTKSIDSTLESEIQRKIENAPILISFYIMIPFAVVLLLFIYPWIVTVTAQLLKSFNS
jgi:hypothetical protein